MKYQNKQDGDVLNPRPKKKEERKDANDQRDA